jgi:rhamnosyltransferase
MSGSSPPGAPPETPRRNGTLPAETPLAAAIIVLFEPDWAQVIANLGCLSGQVGVIILVDNTPAPVPPPGSLPDTAVLIVLGRNTGIAHAQNIGAAEAERRGASHLVFFDQDSRISCSLVTRLLDALATLEALGEKVAAVGPRPFDTTKGERHAPPFVAIEPVGRRFTRVLHLISSGSLVPLESWRVVGPLDASLFIDSVDHEWCWRARRQGYSSFVDETSIMPHALGSTVVRFFGQTMRDTLPVRLYYQFRNQVRLMLHYRSPPVPRGWRVKRLATLPIKFVANLLLMPDRWTRARHMIAGIRDGVLDRGGPLAASPGPRNGGKSMLATSSEGGRSEPAEDHGTGLYTLRRPAASRRVKARRRP